MRKRMRLSGLKLVASALAISIATIAQAQTSTSVSVTGEVVNPTTYFLSGLQALPPTTQTDTFTSNGVPRTDTYTGPTLWSVLQTVGVATDPAVKNDVLNKYVIATGADGYKAAFSLGEISPNFGNKTSLVAIGNTSGTLPGSDGVARVTAPGDVAGGRYVSNLTNLTVASGPPKSGIGGGTSSNFSVNGEVQTPLTFDLAFLKSFPATTTTVTYTSAGKPVTDTYTGALLWTVLNAAGLLLDPATKNDILRKLVTVTGSDGYQVTFALGELDPRFGNAPVLVAYGDELGQLGPGGSEGFARLVVPGDIAGGRYVSNIVEMTVFDGVDAAAVPGPVMGAGLPGLIVAFGGLVAVARRRRVAAA